MQERINYLQTNRNKVMHHKTLSKQEFFELRKTLNEVNRKLEIAVVNVENRIYTEDDLKQVLSALGQITLEVIRPKYDVNALMPAIVSNEDLSSFSIAAERWADIAMPSTSVQALEEAANNFAVSSAALHSKELIDNMSVATSAFAETIKTLQLDDSVLQKLQEQAQVLQDLTPSESLVMAYKSARRAYDAMNPQIDNDRDGSEDDCK